MNKPKLCPFCGNKDIYVGWAQCGAKHAKCKNCFASTRLFHLPGYSEEEIDWNTELENKSIEAWNQRIEK